MTRILLVRHGQTVDNVNQIMQGQTHGRLTLFGREQARALGRRLRSEGIRIDHFVSSDLGRAVETCQILINELTASAQPSPTGDSLPCPSPNEAIRLEPLLRERDWGSFTGRYIPDLQNEVWPDDIEPLSQMKARAQQFLQLMHTLYPGQTVLAVGHGIINKAVRSVYCERPMNEIPKMQNCEYIVLELHHRRPPK